eukprot:jgi/Psemu1/33786/gm1.33786_g
MNNNQPTTRRVSNSAVIEGWGTKLSINTMFTRGGQTLMVHQRGHIMVDQSERDPDQVGSS